jgi:hypothetical protein
LTQATGYLAMRNVRLRRPPAAVIAGQRQLCGDATLSLGGLQLPAR